MTIIRFGMAISILCIIMNVLLYVSLLAGKENSYNIQQKGLFLSYACGFDEESKFVDSLNIKYSLIAIIFLIFDLEIIFILPTIAMVSTYSYEFYFFLVIILGMMLFWLILSIGIYWEIYTGNLGIY